MAKRRLTIEQWLEKQMPGIRVYLAKVAQGKFKADAHGKPKKGTIMFDPNQASMCKWLLEFYVKYQGKLGGKIPKKDAKQLKSYEDKLIELGKEDESATNEEG